MTIGRREVLKAILVTAAGGAVFHATSRLARALVARETSSPLIWLNPGGDDLNLLGLLGRQYPDFMELVLSDWDLREFGPLMPTGYTSVEQEFERAPVLVLESIPAGKAGEPAPGKQIAGLAGQVKAVILAGSEACFGGLHTRSEDVEALEALCRRVKTPLVKIPGVPAAPHHLIGTLSHLEYFGFPRLDGLRRPAMYFSELVCASCERKDDLEIGRFAAQLGEEGCLLNLGCKGPITYNSCSEARWNGGENWCVGAGGPCAGCSEPGFPDHGGLGLTGGLRAGGLQNVSPLLRNLEITGWALLGAVAAGVGVNRVRAWLAPLHGDAVAPGTRRD